IGGFACGIDAFEPFLNADEMRLVWDMGLETLAIAMERIAKHAIDCAFVPGYLSAAYKPRDVDALRRSRAEAARRFVVPRLRYGGRDA
ncbi:FAD-dependent oxidoreductase, partial [Burkholderia pseudomallei]